MNVGAITAREAARNGRRTALVDAVSGRHATFAELERRVDGLARALTADPRVARGDRIAILAYNCFEYFEVYLAAARAGLLAQGLNWRLAADELERIVHDAGTRVLVSDASLGELASELDRRANIDVSLRFGAGSDGSYDDYVESGTGVEVELAEPGDDDPILIIYTGGSTGEPKGAVHTQRSCLTAMMNNTVAERVVPSDRYLMLGQMFHSAAILALNYLLHGATVVLVPRFEPRLSLEVIESERATASLAFPPMVNYMLAEADGRRFDLSSLRNMQYGGGPISPRVITEMMDLLPGGLIQCYGSTEHVGVTFLSQEDHVRGREDPRAPAHLRPRGLPLRGAPDGGRQAGPVGRPHAGRDRGPLGVEHDRLLAAARPHRARYLKDGWLATGDLAVADEDGYLTIVDRVKDLIVSGGENIYPAQVENAIAGHPSVLEVAVVGVPDAFWGEAVKAFVVLRTGREAGADEIRDRVRDTLGSYQKPRHVEFVSELPKTSVGKIAKKSSAAAPSPSRVHGEKGLQAFWYGAPRDSGGRSPGTARPDRRSRPAVGAARPRGAGAHGGDHRPDAHPAAHRRPDRPRAAALQPDVPPVRGARAAALQPRRGPAPGPHGPPADGPPGDGHQHRRPARGQELRQAPAPRRRPPQRAGQDHAQGPQGRRPRQRMRSSTSSSASPDMTRAEAKTIAGSIRQFRERINDSV